MTFPCFVYSFDRDSFVGEYATRNEALRDAIAKAEFSIAPVMTVYTGQRIATDPRALGHARLVIDAMRRKVGEYIGDEAGNWLRNLPDSTVTELDLEMERVIKAWLARHKLEPKATQVQAIVEHPVNNPMMSSHLSSTPTEVRDLGTV